SDVCSSDLDVPWSASYEAEDATYEGSGYSLNGPEGSPDNVQDFYTSGGYNVGGLRTGSDGSLTFDVDVPEDGTYDLSVFANSLNTDEAVEDEGRSEERRVGKESRPGRPHGQ